MTKISDWVATTLDIKVEPWQQQWLDALPKGTVTLDFGPPRLPSMKRRRSSYGAYLAAGLYREGCGGKADWCEDCTEIVLDASMREDEPFYDTYRRVVMRHEMRRPLLARSGSRVRSAYRRKHR